MKIRTGFVSNSSSSSFIITCEDKDCCPTCGFNKLIFFEMIAQKREYEESAVYSKEEVIEELEKYIKDIKEDIEYLKTLPQHLPWSQWASWSTADYIKIREGELVKKEELVKRFNEYQNLYKVDIDYHNECLNYLFDFAVKSGAVKIIEKNMDYRKERAR